MRDDHERLLDILEAIERIERHTSDGRSAFSDELVQTWVVHTSFRAAHPLEEWALAAGLRNVIVHEYFGVDVDVVWGVVERDLPNLKSLVLEILGKPS